MFATAPWSWGPAAFIDTWTGVGVFASDLLRFQREELTTSMNHSSIDDPRQSGGYWLLGCLLYVPTYCTLQGAVQRRTQDYGLRYTAPSH